MGCWTRCYFPPGHAEGSPTTPLPLSFPLSPLCLPTPAASSSFCLKCPQTHMMSPDVLSGSELLNFRPPLPLSDCQGSMEWFCCSKSSVGSPGLRRSFSRPGKVSRCSSTADSLSGLWVAPALKTLNCMSFSQNHHILTPVPIHPVSLQLRAGVFLENLPLYGQFSSLIGGKPNCLRLSVCSESTLSSGRLGNSLASFYTFALPPTRVEGLTARPEACLLVPSVVF